MTLTCMQVRLQAVHAEDAMPVPPPEASISRAVLFSDSRLCVVDCRCTSGPLDKPFTETHRRHSLSYVRKGSFGCHCRGRRFDLVAGSLFVGHPGDEYVCTHEHPLGGDECLSFQFEPELVEHLGGDAAAWRCGSVPPLPALVVLGELAQATARGRADVALDELGMLIGARFVGLSGARRSSPRAASPGDRRRALRAAQWIEAHAAEAVDLAGAAAEAGLSKFHFLRVFTRVFAVTPHQHLIRCRLRRATRLLAESSMPVTDVALETGFADLSNFVRTFARAAGMPPLGLRRLAKSERDGERARLQRQMALN